MKKNVFILFVVLLTTSVFMSCSSDDDNDNGKVENTIIINGKEYLNDESASVSYNSYSQSISFEAGFSNPESLMDISYFTIASNDAASVDKLTNGMELKDKVKEFHKNTDLGSSYTYTTVGGKVVVDNVTSETITLRYDDFKFTKNGSEYTIKGRVLYHKN